MSIVSGGPAALSCWRSLRSRGTWALTRGLPSSRVPRSLVQATRPKHLGSLPEPSRPAERNPRSDQAVLEGGDDGLDPVAQVEFGEQA
jgi:hypothetical protein